MMAYVVTKYQAIRYGLVVTKNHDVRVAAHCSISLFFLNDRSSKFLKYESYDWSNSHSSAVHSVHLYHPYVKRHELYLTSVNIGAGQEIATWITLKEFIFETIFQHSKDNL